MPDSFMLKTQMAGIIFLTRMIQKLLYKVTTHVVCVSLKSFSA